MASPTRTPQHQLFLIQEASLSNVGGGTPYEPKTTTPPSLDGNFQSAYQDHNLVDIIHQYEAVLSKLSQQFQLTLQRNAALEDAVKELTSDLSERQAQHERQMRQQREVGERETNKALEAAAREARGRQERQMGEMRDRYEQEVRQVVQQFEQKEMQLIGNVEQQDIVAKRLKAEIEDQKAERVVVFGQIE